LVLCPVSLVTRFNNASTMMTAAAEGDTDATNGLTPEDLLAEVELLGQSLQELGGDYEEVTCATPDCGFVCRITIDEDAEDEDMTLWIVNDTGSNRLCERKTSEVVVLLGSLTVNFADATY